MYNSEPENLKKSDLCRSLTKNVGSAPGAAGKTLQMGRKVTKHGTGNRWIKYSSYSLVSNHESL